MVDLVQVISSTGDSSDGQFAQDWQRYAPHQVLARYGEPLQVDLHIVPWTPEYTLGMAYEYLGFFIVYGGTPTRISPTTMRVCFDFAQVNFVALSLRSPQPEAAPQEGVARPLEEVTEMDIETFYALLRDPDSDICFETPTELWPYPSAQPSTLTNSEARRCPHALSLSTDSRFAVDPCYGRVS